MKNLQFLTCIGAFLIAFGIQNAWAQTTGLSYQAVAIDVSNTSGFGRNSRGEVMASKEINVRFIVREGSEDGTIVYEEFHSTKTDPFGIFRLIVGDGKNSEAFLHLNELAWTSVQYFLEVSIDLGDGNGFIVLGTERLVVPPYSFHGGDQTLSLSGNELSISGGNSVTLEEINPENELIEELTLSGTILQITDAGGTKEVDLMSAIGEEELNNDEIQNLQLNGDLLTITKNEAATTIDLSLYRDIDTQLTESQVDAFVSNNGYFENEIDGSVSNELQDLQLQGNSLTLSNDPTPIDIDLSVYLDDTNTQLTETEVDAFVSNNGYLTTEVDGSLSNELQDLQLSGNNLTLSNDPTPTVIDLSSYLDDTQLTEAEVDAFVSDNGYLISEVDGSVSNELQDLQLSGNSLTLSNDPTPVVIDLSSYLDDTNTQLTEAEVDAFVSDNGYLTSEIDGSVSNELQDLQLSGSNLSLTNDPTPGAIDLGSFVGGAFSTTGNVTSNAPGDFANDDFVFGSPQLDDDGDSNHDTRMFFEKTTGAFRVGGAESNHWASRGDYSVAMGFNSAASGSYSTAIGSFNNSSGSYSVALGRAASANGVYSFAAGRQTQALGTYATAMGYDTEAESYAVTALGQFNLGGGASFNWVDTDPLFEIGNGVDDGNRSNALTILKNGNTDVNGNLVANSLGIDGQFDLPITDGSAGQALITDGAGNLGWGVTPAASSVFTIVSNVISPSLGNLSADDFVIGSGQLDDDGNPNHDRRMFFDKSLGAFRAGGTSSTGWDLRGNYSTAFGYNSIASGSYSSAFGEGAEASGQNAIAMGEGATASANHSVAIGHQAIANGGSSMALGINSESVGGSHAFGNDAEATGGYSTAIGQDVRAIGDWSVSIGNFSEASGEESFAAGTLANAQSFRSIAIGPNNIGGGDPTNWIATDPLFEIGNGHGGSQSNALTILKNGNMGIGTTSPGYLLEVQGTGSGPHFWAQTGSVTTGDRIASFLNGANDAIFEVFADTDGRSEFSGRVGIGTTPDAPLHAIGGTDVSLSGLSGYLILGYSNGTHLAIDNNEIMAKADGTTPATLLLQNEGGDTYIGSNLGDTYIGGTLYVSGNLDVDGVFTNSDLRLKRDIQLLKKSLTKLNEISGVSYYWNSLKHADTTTIQIGVIAQDIQKQFPELVTKKADGYLAVEYMGLIPYMIEAIKELKKEIEELKTEKKELVEFNRSFEERMSSIEALLRAYQAEKSVRKKVLPEKD